MKRSHFIKQVLFYTAWLAIVIGGLVLAMTRFRTYGIWGIAAIIIGVGMLIIFVLDHPLVQNSNNRIKTRLGDFTLLFIIIAVADTLLASVILTAATGNWLTAFVFAVFTTVFVRILIDYLIHLKHKYKNIT